MSKPQAIGHSIPINLPANGIYNLPAKVDTGADSSAIWASDIKEENGELSFVLLDKASEKYTGEVIKTKDFRRVRIVNSFGHEERRYRVHLSIEIEGHRVRARFSLANRELKSYPALIGRGLLNKRFVVDVSKASQNTSTSQEGDR